MKGEELSYPIRLNVFLARCGVGSRRRCDSYIAEGKVKVNGKTVTEMGVQVQAGDNVVFEGRPVHPEQTSLYIALNKPPRVLCSNHDPEGLPLAVDQVQHAFAQRLFTVGRLDFLSSGLVFLTNDGAFAQAIMHPSAGIEKEYVVETKKPIPEELLQRYTQGLYIKGERYRARSYRYRSPRKVSITLVEGKNREIRRVFMYGRIAIRRLRRIRIGPVQVKGIPQGGYRHLCADEVRHFLSRSAKGT